MIVPRSRLPLAAWLFLTLVALAAIGWGAHQPFSWDADNIAPGSVLKGLARGFGPGWYSSYGPIPYYVTGLVYLPALAFMKLTGELGAAHPEYPWGFAHPDVSVTALVLIARLVTLALALFTAWTLWAAARRGGASRGWIVPVLLAGSPVFVYYARTSNVDMHYVVWLALGFHLLETPNAGPRRIALAAAAAIAAICSKEQAAPFALVILLDAARSASRPRAGFPRSPRSRPLPRSRISPRGRCRSTSRAGAGTTSSSSTSRAMRGRTR